jgi:nitrogen-specific signal transduction histidine kinase
LTLRPAVRPPALVAALAALSAAGLAAALAARLLPVRANDLESRARRFREGAATAFESDARTLQRVAARIQKSAEFASIVDAGGAEVRPARLFSILTQALPRGSGWGAMFFDGSGRAVAWSGDTPGIDPPAGDPGPGLEAFFHVTRFNLVYRSPRGETAERRGVVLVTRRYPSGILRPDLVEYLGLAGGPTTLRLKARAASRPDRLLALSVERGTDEEADEDVARERTRWPAGLAALALLALGARVRAPVTGIAAARFALLLGAPRAGSGCWARVFGGREIALGLASTPADLFLTGVVALLLLRILLRRFAQRPERRLKPAAALVLAIVACTVPFLLSRAAAFSRPDLFDSLDLLPDTAAEYVTQTGAVALAAAIIGAAALALAVRPRPGGGVAAAAAALAFGGSLSTAGSPWSFPLAVAGSFAAASALAGRLGGFASRDLLARAATAVFLVAAACAAGAAGLADGKLRRLDAELERAERAEEAREGESAERLRGRWERLLNRPELEPWRPAGDRTDVSDLARALWVRGATEAFPATGDTLRLFDGRKIASSFGLLRPGTDANATTFAAAVPVPLAAEWVHVPFPRESERDPLLLAAVSRDLPERTIVEKLEYDAAGRPKGGGGTDRIELPRELVARARRDGTAAGAVETAGGARRVRVKLAPAGFTGFASPGSPPILSLGVAVAAGEASLVLVLPALLVARRSRYAPGRAAPGRGRFFGTFRARLVTLVFVFGALPLAGSIVVVRVALERHAALDTARRARSLLDEARRSLESSATGLLGPDELNRAAAVIGSDLLLYRDGKLDFASRAVPVAAEVAPGRLPSSLAEALAEGESDATAAANRRFAGSPRVVEAAETISRDGRDALAVVLAEDEAARTATDSLVLFTVGVAMLAFGLGGRAALALGKPIENLIEGTEKLGSGIASPPIERPENVDLARLVEAFETMAARVRERTESLAQERAAAVGLLSNLTAAVILFRREDGAVILANPAADFILPGGSLPERVARPGWERLRQALEEARTRPSPYETRVAVPGDGRERVFRCVVAALASEGSESRSIVLLEDLTDFIRADRLTAWVEAARAMAHDVKNPLTPIRLAAERLVRLGERGERRPGAAEEAGKNILRQVGILTERIGRLARFSDPSALEKSRLDASAVAGLLTEVAADFSAHERLRVSVDVDVRLALVEADRSLLRDALTNFVVNAVEAIGERGGSIRLTATNSRLRGGAPGVRFACEDDGPGVSAEARRRLFEPTFSTKSRGSGMGLAAVRRAVERHVGSVFAEPREGGGLVIGFILPGIS